MSVNWAKCFSGKLRIDLLVESSFCEEASLSLSESLPAGLPLFSLSDSELDSDDSVTGSSRFDFFSRFFSESVGRRSWGLGLLVELSSLSEATSWLDFRAIGKCDAATQTQQALRSLLKIPDGLDAARRRSAGANLGGLKSVEKRNNAPGYWLAAPEARDGKNKKNNLSCAALGCCDKGLRGRSVSRATFSAARSTGHILHPAARDFGDLEHPARLAREAPRRLCSSILLIYGLFIVR